uniref:Uncharacterized protein C7orf72-like n=1 Tax=Phallusia mammillata TaxID=59560 RepID=A0A6F9DTQ2_9ASCI|nr:uncharacterized protein C7orf72-like [Phallusia mammillata]
MAETSAHPRPEMGTIMKTDANARGNFAEEIEFHRSLRHTKFPTIKGPEGNYDYPSFQGRLKDSPAFIKWNIHAQAPHMGYSLAPHRDNHPIVDPASGFVSTGADEDLVTGVKKLASMVQTSDKVQLGTPTTKPPDSGRPQTPPKAPWTQEMKSDEREAKWSARKVSDTVLRSQCGGWTSPSKVIPKQGNDHENLLVGTFTFKPGNWRDEAAKKYMFTSMQQQNFDMVDWDSRLPAKLKPCESTLEKTPDPISQRLTTWPKRYEAVSNVCQTLGRSWDWFQMRDKCHGNRPYSYTSHFRKSGHIPNYEGSIGAYNFEAKDHPYEEYRPLTALRTPKPRYTDTARRPNIPGYKGSAHWTGIHSAHSVYPAPQPPSTAYVHRRLPTPPNTSPFAKRGPMSRMVTTVPPKNPFNQVEIEPVLA